MVFSGHPLWQLASSWNPLFRTLSFALVAASGEVVVGFALAQCLRVKNVKLGQSMVLLLVPALIGSTAVGFVFRNLPTHIQTLLQRSPVGTWAALLAVEVWQYTPMCVYMFWHRHRTIQPKVRAFATTSLLSQSETIRHVVWPHCRNLAFVLALFGFLQAAGEYSKTDQIFQASPATKTELMSHWIEQNHRVILKDFPSAARDLALAYSGLLMIAALVASIVGAFLITISMAVLVHAGAAVSSMVNRRLQGRPLRNGTLTLRRPRLVWPVILIMVALGPFLQLPADLLGNGSSPTRSMMADASALFVGALAPITAAALLVAIITISFGIVLRLMLPRHTAMFNSKSVPLLSSILTLHCVPAIGLAYCALYWFHAVYEQRLPMPLYWALAESVLGFSILGAFSLYVHFDLPQRDIDFCRSAGVTVREAARYVLLGRFRLSYCLVGLFAFTVVLNEDTISSVLSAFIDTPVAELQKKTTGPGANYPQAALMIIMIMALVSAGIITLNLVLKKQTTREA